MKTKEWWEEDDTESSLERKKGLLNRAHEWEEGGGRLVRRSGSAFTTRPFPRGPAASVAVAAASGADPRIRTGPMEVASWR
mmetsp:Transcript_3158/g.8194  ORF Transcript_3158/g.8194 Transcript_3158/m.8194 type:complete len:81 (+) Transcript_3158:74-316(+)